MPLPELIEIVPLDKPVRAEITVPGSKSITNRALILAALADGEVILRGALWSEDTQIMVECLQKLGFGIKVENDPDEFCNRTITVKGLGGKIPGGTGFQPVKGDRQDACLTTELFVGNAGTAARFLAAFVCLGNGVYRLHGTPRMHERPQAALFQALRELGYRVESENGNDKLPVVIGHRVTESTEKNLVAAAQAASVSSASLWQKKCKVSIGESSQFASALLLCAKIGNWEIEIVGENAEESPYVAMTSKMVDVFPRNGGEFQIEPDASSASYFLAAQKVSPNKISHEKDLQITRAVREKISYSEFTECIEQNDSVYELFQAQYKILRLKDVELAQEFEDLISRRSWIHILRWMSIKRLPSDWQIDSAFPKYVNKDVTKISRLNDLGDSIMTLIAIAPLIMPHAIRFTDLGRLRVQECERVVALRTELTKCGAKVIEEGDTLTVYPSPLHGAEIETYNDHRMAMCFAVLGLKVPGIKIKNPACVKKTFPNFFQKLAAPPPHGLGATILDAKTGKKLSHEELFAD